MRGDRVYLFDKGIWSVQSSRAAWACVSKKRVANIITLIPAKTPFSLRTAGKSAPWSLC